MTRWVRFASVGVLGFTVQLGVLYVLTAILGMAYAAAIVVAVEVAIVHNFVWHERWTWRDRFADSAPIAALARLARFNAASGALSLAGNLVVTVFLVEAFGFPLIIANVLAITTLTIANFVLADRVAFARVGLVLLCASVFIGGVTNVEAASPTPETIAAWQRYVASVDARRLGEGTSADDFRLHDRPRLLRGEVVVDNVAGGTVDVPGGTISHWRGAVYVPQVTVSELLEAATLQGNRVRHPHDVIAARLLDHDGDSFRLFLKLKRQALVTVAYNTEHQVNIERRGPNAAVSRSVSTKIAEIEGVGTPQEREKRPGEDRGFMWRLVSYWRYQAVPGGVIVELESLTLSRDLPWGIGTIAGPVIDRIARDSVTRTLAVLR